MKELSFEKMENQNGGIAYSYCDLIWFWFCGGGGYQGPIENLYYAAHLCGFM